MESKIEKFVKSTIELILVEEPYNMDYEEAEQTCAAMQITEIATRWAMIVREYAYLGIEECLKTMLEGINRDIEYYIKSQGGQNEN